MCPLCRGDRHVVVLCWGRDRGRRVGLVAGGILREQVRVSGREERLAEEAGVSRHAKVECTRIVLVVVVHSRRSCEVIITHFG